MHPKPKPKPRPAASAGPEVPASLGPEAADLWRQLQAEYGIRDQGGLLLLRQAAESFQRANEAAAILKAEGLVKADKYGQSKPHPAVVIERDSRKNLLAFLRALNLDVQPNI
jgi:phage terminase small subunit